MRLLKFLFLGTSLGLLVLGSSRWIFPIEPLLENVHFSKVYYDRNGQLLSARLTPDDKWRFQSHLDEISPLLIKALLTFEDKRFYEHMGVDYLAVLRAFWQNLSSGRVVSGASTITMQVARLLETERRYHSWWGKVIQTFRAFQLEWALSKDEILEWYFNLGPYGGNIEGAVSASWFYFQKPPSRLNVVEAIALAITPKSPNLYRPDRFPISAQKQCWHLVEKMKEQQQLTKMDLWFVDCDHPPGQLHELPRYANHLIDRFQTNSGNTSELVFQGHPSDGWNHIRTTLDLDLQLGVESIITRYVKGLQSKGIHNAATLVLDNETSEILVYVGSSNFDDKSHAGEVDGVRASRSPGSTLKPFIYAQALESGLYNSRTLLANVPVAFPGYRPQNYRPEDLGIAHFDEALQQSLNLPAVALNVALGKDKDLLSVLWKAGVSTLPHSRGHYGQSLVLGGGELRLDELVALYSVFAREGQLRPAQLVLSQQKNQSPFPKPTEMVLLTPEAAFIISQILKEIPHPEYGLAAEYFQGMPKVAWKTGTSSRQRDAWTIGFNPRYSVGVWVGNFDGSPVENMTGRRYAAPLFFEIFRFLTKHQANQWPPPPPHVIQQTVCSLSGHLPNVLCPGETQAWWIAGTTKPDFCQMHIQLLTHRQTGKRLSEECIWEKEIPDTKIQRSLAVLWPQTTGGWLARSQSAVIFPPYDAECQPQEALTAPPPILQTPMHGEKYLIHMDHQSNTPFAHFDKIAFSASVNNEVNQLDWYLNGQKIASTLPGKPYLWTPIPGSHELILMDDFGRATQAKFQVVVAD